MHAALQFLASPIPCIGNVARGLCYVTCLLALRAGVVWWRRMIASAEIGVAAFEPEQTRRGDVLNIR